MLDLNDLRVFEKVAALRSFSRAARGLGLPRSTVSRSVSRLEAALGVRMLQRTTRDVQLTHAGAALHERCADVLRDLTAALDEIERLHGGPRGHLRIAAGIGFGINVLSAQLPEFLRRYPEVDVTLELDSRASDLVADSVDVAIRMHALPDSGLVAVRLGAMKRYLCAAPAYLARRGAPRAIEELVDHDLIEMPGRDGRPRAWRFTRGKKTKAIETRPRVCVNEALTVHRLVMNGAGIGVISGYLSGPEIAAGRLVQLCRAWRAPAVDVHLVFPSRRELAPSVRAFVEFMKEVSGPGRGWQDDPLDAPLAAQPTSRTAVPARRRARRRREVVSRKP